MQRRIQIFSCRFYAGKPYSFFIGLRRINNSNTNDAFQWIDGTLLSGGSGYSDWERNEPNDHREKCVTMGRPVHFNPAYEWIDISCTVGDRQSRYICERNITGEQQRLLIIGSVELRFREVATFSRVFFSVTSIFLSSCFNYFYLSVFSIK